MRKYLLIPILLYVNVTFAQNWTPFNFEEVFYYQTDTAAYPDVVFRTDSLEIIGTDTFGCFNTVFKAVDDVLFDKYTEQFWQKKMRNAGDGLFYFTSPYSLALQTHAQPGDSWTFNLTTGATATILSADTATIIGTLDSIKTLITSDGYQIVLSKEHGLISFPARMSPSSLYCTLTGIGGRDIGIRLPDFADYFDYQVGDIFQYSYYYWYFKWDSYGRLIKFTVDDVIKTDTIITVSVSGIQLIGEHHDPSHEETTAYIDTTFYILPADHSVANKLPNAYADMYLEFPFYWYLTDGHNYDIAQTWGVDSLNNQTTSDAFCMEGIVSNSWFVAQDENQFAIEPYYDMSNYCVQYTSGLGLTHVEHTGIESGGELRLTAYRKNGDTVGVLLDDTAFIASIAAYPMQTLKVYPNPVTDMLYCSYPMQSGADWKYHIVDLNGKVVIQGNSYGGDILSVPTAILPAGLYTLLLFDQQHSYYTATFIQSE